MSACKIIETKSDVFTDIITRDESDAFWMIGVEYELQVVPDQSVGMNNFFKIITDLLEQDIIKL